MYKQLFVIRHGKSTWENEKIQDLDRPLKERGINDGYKMAEQLLAKSNIPDLIVSSPAIRALHSATIFARTFKYPSDSIVINNGIYMAGTHEILELITQTNDNINSLMIFGHNPTFTDLANYYLSDPIDNLPTTGIVGLTFDIKSWQEIDKKKLKKWFFDFPKKHN